MLNERLFPWLILPAVLASALPAGLESRQVSGRPAQWKDAGGLVRSTIPTQLFNTAQGRYLGVSSSGGFVWQAAAPGQGTVLFENCTRPGEAVYSSDRVAIRIGGSYMASGPGGATLGRGGRVCDFRLIPSRAGLTPAGSGDGVFGIFSISANRYVVHQPVPITRPPPVLLRWEAPPGGQAPGDVRARADFIPVEVLTTSGTVGAETVRAVHLTIQNIGSVRSSASQREMELTINGERVELVIVHPVEPGAILRSPVRLTKPVSECAVVHLDTRPGLKFQVGEGAFPNDDVFANDKKVLSVRGPGGPAKGRGPLARPCEPVVVR